MIQEQKLEAKKVILVILKAAISTGGTKFGLKCRHEVNPVNRLQCIMKVFLVYGGVIVNDL